MVEYPLFTWLYTYILGLRASDRLESQFTTENNYTYRNCSQGSIDHKHRHLLSQRKGGTPSRQSFARAHARSTHPTQTHAARTQHRQNM